MKLGVTIESFYDDVRDLTSEERSALAELPFAEEGLREEVGAIFERRQHVDVAEPEPLRDRAADVVVEVEPDRHAQSRPCARSLATSG